MQGAGGLGVPGLARYMPEQVVPGGRTHHLGMNSPTA